MSKRETNPSLEFLLGDDQTSNHNNKRTKTDLTSSEDDPSSFIPLTRILLNDTCNDLLFKKLKTTLSTHNKRIKFVLLGDEKVGKSTFISRFQSSSNLIKTIQLSEHIFATVTSVRFVNPLCYVDFWELHSDSVTEAILPSNVVLTELLLNANCPFMKDADCALLMFSVSWRLTYKNIPLWHRLAHNARPEIRTALCGNMADVDQDRKVKPKNITYHRKRNIRYFDTSSIINYNLLSSVECLIRKVLEMEELKLEPYYKLKPFDENANAVKIVMMWDEHFQEMNRMSLTELDEF